MPLLGCGRSSGMLHLLPAPCSYSRLGACCVAGQASPGTLSREADQVPRHPHACAHPAVAVLGKVRQLGQHLTHATERGLNAGVGDVSPEEIRWKWTG